jgi:ribosomal protein S18 acetylase RimI-like enzyme
MRPRCHAGPVDRPTTAGDDHRQTHWRVPFELAGDAAARQLADPPSVTWRAADDDEELVHLFARALEGSMDPRDQAEVRRAGAPAVAARMIEDAHSGRVYRCERDWRWVVDVNGMAAGVVFPVVFTACERGTLDEGTIYHIGVVPEQRGRGLGHLLLGRATDTLLAHGVWQISCDTATENAPMIRLFERHNWTRRPAIEVAVH